MEQARKTSKGKFQAHDGSFPIISRIQQSIDQVKEQVNMQVMSMQESQPQNNLSCDKKNLRSVFGAQQGKKAHQSQLFLNLKYVKQNQVSKKLIKEKSQTNSQLQQSAQQNHVRQRKTEQLQS